MPNVERRYLNGDFLRQHVKEDTDITDPRNPWRRIDVDVNARLIEGRYGLKAVRD